MQTPRSNNAHATAQSPTGKASPTTTSTAVKNQFGYILYTDYELRQLAANRSSVYLNDDDYVLLEDTIDKDLYDLRRLYRDLDTGLWEVQIGYNMNPSVSQQERLEARGEFNHRRDEGNSYR